MLLEQFGVRVRDLRAARRFYVAIAGALGLVIIDVSPTSFMIGRAAAKPVPILRIAGGPRSDEEDGAPVHFAFTASDPDSVDRFHRAAIAAGGTDNGGPGIRGDGYSALAIDPDGNVIEVGLRG